LKTTLTGKLRLFLLLSLAGLLSFATPNVRAGQSDQSNQGNAGDPPTRVARISYVDGSVSLQPGGEGDWGSAGLNRPMTIGDKLWTDKDSRAELQTGVVSIHLGSMTALAFLNLDQNITQMRLAEGSINFRVKEIREGDVYEVDTPNLAFTIKQAGAFRIDVDENGDSTGITVIRGEGQVAASGKTYDLEPGQRGVFNGSDDVQSAIAQAPQADGLDQWANDRDLREQDSVSARYVPPETPGTADLDNNGTWSQEPDYGHVWYPSQVPEDWAPYSNGYWSYVGPWGWTWVGYEPWGFAPYHYGRWSYIGGRWGWCPGPIFGPAIYGPAFVGFLGGGFGFGVGWFPLGFGEPFNPWFRCGRGFVERINVHNTFIRDRGIFNGNFHNFNYAYAHNARAVTAASRGAFTGSQMIRRGDFHVTEASLRGARVTNSVGLSPSRQSAFGASNLRGNASRPPSSVQNRSVMARTAPARGASDMRVRTMNTNRLTPGRAGNFSPNTGSNRSPNNGGTFGRQNDLSRDRPSSAGSNNMRMQNGNPNNPSSQRITNGTHTWEAQGNSTDRGRAPQGFGNSNSPSNNSGNPARMNRQDRPSWAGSGAPSNYGGSRSMGNANPPGFAGGNLSYDAPQRNAPTNNRSYAPPSRTDSAPGRSYSAPVRSYPAPGRSYSAPSPSYSAPSRSYSAPSRSYSAPSRSYSAPSRSYSAPSHSSSAPSRSSGGSGGGGGSRGGGGGGASHGGGGGGSHPHR
jgi:uncharacterized membrane protein YgcG